MGEVRHGEPLLEVENLSTHFSLRGSFLDRIRGQDLGSVRAVDGVSFTLDRGEVLGVVGESGSGKTTLGRTLLRLVAPTGGSVRFDGIDIASMSERRFRPLRQRMQLVFQDPHASLNPAMTIGTSVRDPLRFHGLADDDAAADRRVSEALERVGLAPAAQFAGKYPGDLSGGQKQRAVIARAIILGPELLIADEPVSMLDMSVRAKILALMGELKRELDLTYVYITHDLATAKFFCDRIAIMYLGRIVELGPASQIYADPKHPYTISLLNAIPEPDPTRGVPRDVPRGEVPDAARVPLGCRFHPRCPRAFEVCGWESRDLHALIEARWAGLGHEQVAEEQEILGDLDQLLRPSLEAEVGSGHADEAAKLLEEIRAAAPDDPFWRGVEGWSVEGGEVRVRFREPFEPRSTLVGETLVECDLTDADALAAAENL